MVYAEALRASKRKFMRVRFPPSAHKKLPMGAAFFSLVILKISNTNRNLRKQTCYPFLPFLQRLTWG